MNQYKLCLVGGGDSVILRDGRFYYKKKSIADYHAYLVEQFEPCFLFTYVLQGDSFGAVPSIPVPEGIHLCLESKSRIRFKHHLLAGLKRMCRLWSIIDHKTVVLAFLPGPYSWWVLPAVLLRRPVFCAYFGSDAEALRTNMLSDQGLAGKAKGSIFRLIQDLAIRMAAIVLVRDHRMLESYKCHPNIHFSKPIVSRSRLFERHDTCSRETVTILFVGSLIQRKGLSYLLEALAQLLQIAPRYRLVLVGDGHLKQELVELTKQLGISENVEFTGYVCDAERLRQFYHDADVFVVPSIREGTPRVITEAMANGLPVIATRVGGTPYLIRDRCNGLLIDPRSPAQIAEAVQELVDTPSLRRRLIVEGLQTVRKQLEETAAEQHARLIMRTLGEKSSKNEDTTREENLQNARRP